MRPTLEGPSRAVVREAEAASRMGASLAGSVIAVDPGHGRTDTGVAAHGIVEAALAWEVAIALAAELERRGATPLLLRSSDDDPSVEDRVRRANGADAAVCVSIHLGDGDCQAGPRAGPGLVSPHLPPFELQEGSSPPPGLDLA